MRALKGPATGAGSQLTARFTRRDTPEKAREEMVQAQVSNKLTPHKTWMDAVCICRLACFVCHSDALGMQGHSSIFVSAASQR